MKPSSSSTLTNVTPDEALAMRGKARLIDVRSPSEWTGDLGHVPGAELVPLDAIAQAAVEWDRDAPLVLICRSGGRSAHAASWLVSQGFTQVMNMMGGMVAYRAAGLPVEGGA